MSSMFGGGGVKMPSQKIAEEPKVITEDEEDVKRRKRAALQNTGRTENLLYGLQAVLKKRLGE